MNEKRLSAYCRAEIENLDRLLVEIKKLTKKSSKADPTLVELAALGTFFHNFYNGIENILKRVLFAKNISVQKSPTWHKDLLERASKEKIISDSTRDKLFPYLTFRHYFIHSYGFELIWREMEPLARVVEETYASFREAIGKYL